MAASLTSSSGPYWPAPENGAPATRVERPRGVREHEPVAGVDDVPAERAVGVARERDRVGHRVGAGDPLGRPELLSSLDHARATASSGPEHVDPRALVRLDRRPRLGRQRVLGRPQHRLAGLGRPAGGRHRVLRAVGGATTTRRRRVAGRGGLQPVDRRASEAELGPLDVGRLGGPRRGRVADPDHLRAAGLLGAGRLQLLERLGARGRQLAAVGEQDGARSGRAISCAAEIAARQSRLGRRSRPRAGCSRRCARDRRPAAPAASATESPPPRASCSWSRRPGSPAAAVLGLPSSPSGPSTAAAGSAAGVARVAVVVAAAAAGDRNDEQEKHRQRRETPDEKLAAPPFAKARSTRADQTSAPATGVRRQSKSRRVLTVDTTGHERPRRALRCRAKPNLSGRTPGAGDPIRSLGRVTSRATEAQALSAPARQLTPQADERGIRACLRCGRSPFASIFAFLVLPAAA